jgi:hypothetical protein
MGSEPLQQVPEHIETSSIAAVAPVAIVASMFDQSGAVGRQQDFLQVYVLGELGYQSLEHYLVPNIIPILSKRTLAFPANLCSSEWGWCRQDGIDIGLTREFLALEEVL